VGGFAQLLRTKLLAELRRAILEQDVLLGSSAAEGPRSSSLQLIHEKNFLGKAMLTGSFLHLLPPFLCSLTCTADCTVPC
jgi:hypothetical protein